MFEEIIQGSHKVSLLCDDKKINCKKVLSDLKRVNLSSVDAIYLLGMRETLKRFANDENVETRLVDEGNIAMNRGLLDYPDSLREVIAPIDHPAYVSFSKEEAYNEVLLSVLHEVAHLKGIEGEREAELFGLRTLEVIHGLSL